MQQLTAPPAAHWRAGDLHFFLAAYGQIAVVWGPKKASARQAASQHNTNRPVALWSEQYDVCKTVDLAHKYVLVRCIRTWRGLFILAPPSPWPEERTWIGTRHVAFSTPRAPLEFTIPPRRIKTWIYKPTDLPNPKRQSLHSGRFPFPVPRPILTAQPSQPAQPLKNIQSPSTTYPPTQPHPYLHDHHHHHAYLRPDVRDHRHCCCHPSR
jgi:hypothetical protein